MNEMLHHIFIRSTLDNIFGKGPGLYFCPLRSMACNLTLWLNSLTGQAGKALILFIRMNTPIKERIVIK